MAIVKAIINGRDYTNFTGVSIKRSLRQLCRSFTLNIAKAQQAFDLNNGDELTLYVDDTLVLTGYINQIAITREPAHQSITVSGRDKCQDLVDCSAPLFEYKDQTAYQILSKITTQFGLKTYNQLSSELKLNKFALTPGVSAHDAIKQVIRQAGGILTTHADGNLILCNELATNIGTLEEGKHFYQFSYQNNNTNHYSQLSVKGQTILWNDDNGSGEGKAVNAGMRYRPLILNAETTPSGLTLQDRADHELKQRLGSGFAFSFKTPSIRSPFNAVGKVVTIKCPSANINKELLVDSVNFHQSQSEQYSEVSCVPQGTYSPPKTAGPKDPQYKQLGAS